MIFHDIKKVKPKPSVTNVLIDDSLLSNDPYTSQNVSYLSVRSIEKEGGSIEQVNDDIRSQLNTVFHSK